MPSMYQILLFATCAFLCFIPGGLGAPQIAPSNQQTPTTTVQCRLCTMLRPGDLCFPSISCPMNGKQTCHSTTIYFKGELQQKMLSCKLKSAAKCGTSDEFPEKGIRFEYQCCDNKDFCNENL